jgi:hypothetical protein
MPTAYLTVPPDAAGELATALVEERLVACLNRIPGPVCTYLWTARRFCLILPGRSVRVLLGVCLVRALVVLFPVVVVPRDEVTARREVKQHLDVDVPVDDAAGL